MVTQELAAHDNMQRIAAFEVLPRYKSNEIVTAILLKHTQYLNKEGASEDSEPYIESARSLKAYRKELNSKVLKTLYITKVENIKIGLVIESYKIF